MKSSQGLLGFGVCLLITCNCPGVNRERMTEMEGGKTETGREKELMHGVYSASKLDADGSLGFNNTHTQIKHTHTHTFSLSAPCPQESLHQGHFFYGL